MNDPGAFAVALDQFLASRDLGALRMSVGTVARAYAPERLRDELAVLDTHNLAIWDRAEAGWQLLLYVRDGQGEGVAEYTDRATAMVLPRRARSLDDARAFALLLMAHFGVISIAIAGHEERRYAAKECIRGGVPGAPWDETVAARVNWDATKWRRARTKLVRLYPVTIIGPDIWAQLPPMPTFDPMPTIEDLGACKVLTAWPTLCDPRDPGFLRGTRALRAWLWPHTIQNPADHPDLDPPA